MKTGIVSTRNYMIHITEQKIACVERNAANGKKVHDTVNAYQAM